MVVQCRVMPRPATTRTGCGPLSTRPLLGARVQDILTLLAYLGGRRATAAPLLVGLGRAGRWALLAAALSDVPCSIWVDMQALDVDDDTVYLGPLYAPLLRASERGGRQRPGRPRRIMLGQYGGALPDTSGQSRLHLRRRGTEPA